MIALIIILGYLFWKNTTGNGSTSEMSSKSTNSSSGSSSNTTTEEEADETIQAGCLSNENLCFSLPSNWSVKQVSDTGGQSTPRAVATNFVGPEGATIYTRTGIDQLGGACTDSNETINRFVTLKSQKTSLVEGVISDSSEAPAVLYVIKAVIHMSDGTYMPLVTISAESDYTDFIKVGKHSLCDGGYANVFRQFTIDPVVGFRVSMTASTVDGIINVDSQAGNLAGDNVSGVATYEEAARILETDGYKQAYAILLSAHRK